jgi:hypothetical protein
MPTVFIAGLKDDKQIGIISLVKSTDFDNFNKAISFSNNPFLLYLSCFLIWMFEIIDLFNVLQDNLPEKIFLQIQFVS